MKNQERKIANSGIWSDSIELRKFLILAAVFFLVIGGYTVIKELKDFVFINIVGLRELNYAKMLSMVVLIPLVFLYSRFVDLLRRHQLIYLYSIIYGLGGIIFAYFLGHPTIGLANTMQSSSRLFGWFFYFFIEGYQPFVISLIWAFVNSITRAEDVQNGYVVVTASSKIGGALTAALAWFYLNSRYVSCEPMSVGSYQLIMVAASCMLLLVPFVIFFLMKKIPASHMHGYEAVYKFEKKHEKELKKQEGSLKENLVSMFSGLYILFRYPYLLGVFGMIFFWEIVNVIFNFIRLSVGQAAAHTPTEFCAFLYGQICLFHLVGLVFVLLGTRNFIRWFGERKSLIAVPLLIGAVICYYLTVRTATAAALAYIVLRAINYAFAYPLRESLYIPTTKAAKFKTKSWIDGFGAKLSKSFGSCYNIIVSSVASSLLFSVHIVFFAGVIGLWTLVANWLGRRFETAVKNNEVIGVEEI
ncbi:MAG: hypothetical protein JW725_02400 [Candidatus Babeliaceae bacterium]|nr:hypothetical protein [Candidatus Babeliaceae bacterium]